MGVPGFRDEAFDGYQQVTVRATRPTPRCRGRAQPQGDGIPGPARRFFKIATRIIDVGPCEQRAGLTSTATCEQLHNELRVEGVELLDQLRHLREVEVDGFVR